MYIPTLDLMITTNCNLGCKYCFLREMEQSEGFITKIDEDILNGIVDNKYNNRFFMFGGEPLLQIDKINEIIEKIKINGKITEIAKQQTLSTLRNVITNGTLIDKKLDEIKKNNLRMQISLDGNKEVHDRNRVYKGTDNGSFDKVIENLQLCKDEGISQGVHGVIQKNTIELLYESQQTLQDLSIYLSGDKNRLSGNLFMVIFEEDYDDDDINTFVDNWIKIQFYIKEKYGVIQMFNILNKDGRDCAVGKSMFQALPDGSLYPCHRYPGNQKIMKDGYCGNIKGEYKDTPHKMKKVINGLYHFHSKFHMLTIQGKTKHTYVCASTSMETTHSPGMINPKYTQLYEEMSQVSDIIRNEYQDEYNKQIEQQNRNRNNQNKKINVSTKIPNY